jgi:hypothetical protein
MSDFVTTVRFHDTTAMVKASLSTVGVDGTDTYDWEWGIQHEGAYLRINEGQVQHRECDGAFKLLALILQKSGIKL